MKWLVVSALLFFHSSISLSDEGMPVPDAERKVPCPQVSGADADGMPLCPDQVKTDSAWQVWRCGYERVRHWHAPTVQEKAASHDLFDAWAMERKEGMSKVAAGKILDAAGKIGAQVCRVTGEDPYLVLWANKDDYSGANLLLREGPNVSRLALILPHSDSDGYFAAGPLGFKGSHALAYVGNGHRRGAITPKLPGRATDFVHSEDNLGYFQTLQLSHLYPNRAWLHLHGDKASNKGLYRPMDGAPFSKAYVQAVETATRVISFGGLNAYFVVDPPHLDTHTYVKSELPAVIYLKQHEAIARILTELEKNKFMWDEPETGAATESFQDGEVAFDIGASEAGEVFDADEKLDVSPESLALATPTPKPWPGPSHLDLKGSHPLMAVVPQYTDLKPGQQPLAQKAADNVAHFYLEMSRGRLQMQGKGVEMDVPFPHSFDKGKLAEVCAMARKLGGWKTMLFNTWKHGGQHASGCAFLVQYLGWVDEHEVGHLLGLAHAGKFDLNPDGSVKAYNQYGDNGNSVMADAVGSKYLTLAQIYHLGWLAPTEYVAVSDRAGGAYALSSVPALVDKKAGLFGVILAPELVDKAPGAQGRPMFISYPPNCVKDNRPCVALHYSSGGGSSLLRNVVDEYVDAASGLHVKVEGVEGAKVRVNVSFDPMK